MTKSTSGGCDQFETFPEAIDQELRTAFCERRQTDRLKTKYRIDRFEYLNSHASVGDSSRTTATAIRICHKEVIVVPVVSVVVCVRTSVDALLFVPLR